MSAWSLRIVSGVFSQFFEFSDEEVDKFEEEDEVEELDNAKEMEGG